FQFSSDSRMLAYRAWSASSPGIWVLNLEPGATIAQYRTTREPNSIRLSPDGHWAVSSVNWEGKGEFHITDLTRRLPQRTIPLPREVYVAFVGNPTGQAGVYTMLPGKGGVIQYWDLEAAKSVGFVPLGLTRENYASFAASKDGR